MAPCCDSGRAYLRMMITQRKNAKKTDRVMMIPFHPAVPEANQLPLDFLIICINNCPPHLFKIKLFSPSPNPTKRVLANIAMRKAHVLATC